MKIYAPNKDANGIWASVVFVNGIGETDNPHLIDWFLTHGYTLETTSSPSNDLSFEIKEDVECLESVEETEKEINFEDMTPNELRKWMMENGYGSKIRNTRNKEKLLEILRG